MDPAQRPVGVIAWGQAMASGVNAYGINIGCEDNPGLTGISLSCNETDMEFYNPPGSYVAAVATRAVVYSPTGQTGQYPADAFTCSSNTSGLFMRTCMTTYANTFTTTGEIFNINTLSSVTPGSGVNSNSPVLFNLHEAYDTGSAQADAYFAAQAIIGTGANPTTDAFRISHGGGPAGQTHYIELDSTITGLKTLGLYPEASYTYSTLPVTCGSATKGARLVVSDESSSAAFFSSYSGSGTNTGPIFCTYNSSNSTYSWVVGG